MSAIALLVAVVVTVGILTVSGPRDASAVVVSTTIDTSALNGLAAQLVFDFIDGNPAVNTVTVSGFAAPAAILGSASPSGGVGGSLPGLVVFTENTTSFVSELVQPLTLGASVAFGIDLTTNFDGPSGSVPDSFSFFILNGTGTDFLVVSDDPTGANALFRIDIVGPPDGIERASDFAPHTPAGSPVPVTLALGATGPGTPVPEPGAFALTVVGGVLIGWRARRAGRTCVAPHDQS